MRLIKKKSNINSQRNSTRIKTSELSKSNRFIKRLCTGYKSFYGRSSIFGSITVRRKGSGVKNLYRNANVLYTNCNSVVLAIFYDSKKTSFLLLKFDLLKKNFFFSNTINSLFPGSLTTIDSTIPLLFLGNSLLIKDIPVGSIVNSVYTKKKSQLNNSVYIKSAGTCGQLIKKDFNTATIRLPSNKVLNVSVYSIATLGVVGNIFNSSVVFGTAGIKRRKSVRPSVRGVAMNPVDHPHGGRTNGGRPSTTPWGLPTKCGFYLKKR